MHSATALLCIQVNHKNGLNARLVVSPALARLARLFDLFHFRFNSGSAFVEEDSCLSSIEVQAGKPFSTNVSTVSCSMESCDAPGCVTTVSPVKDVTITAHCLYIQVRRMCVHNYRK